MQTQTQTLTIDQQKILYNKLYERIIDLHVSEFKKDLNEFTKNYRNKKYKGIVLLDYINIKDMILSVKNKNFVYQWVSKNDAQHIKYGAINKALLSMDPKTDCILACSLTFSLEHLYVNCVKIKDIAS